MQFLAVCLDKNSVCVCVHLHHFVFREEGDVPSWLSFHVVPEMNTFGHMLQFYLFGLVKTEKQSPCVLFLPCRWPFLVQ